MFVFLTSWMCKKVCVYFVDLQVPVLTRNPSTDQLMTNFDPYVFEVIKESEYMIKMNLDIPEAAKVLIHSRDKLLSYYDQMQVSGKGWYVFLDSGCFNCVVWLDRLSLAACLISNH